MIYKLTIGNLILMVLMLLLSIIFNNSIIIKYLFWLSGLLFACSIFVVVPIFEYVKSEEKKISKLISPTIYSILIITFLLYVYSKNKYNIFIICILLIIITINEILEKKKISLSNMLCIVALILGIVMNIKL